MYAERAKPVSGHVFAREGKRGPVWYAKWRDVDGQHQKALGPGSRREAQAELEAILTDARRGALRRVRVGLLFSDIAAEWLRHGELGRGWKPTTIKDYRSAVNAHLLPAFGAKRVDAITSRSIERWRSEWLAEASRTRQAAKLVSVLHAIFERARKTQGLALNPVATVERYTVPYDRTAYDFYSPEQVMALVRAAASEQDGALYLVAAFTGLRRGELLALRWRDVDFGRQAIRVERNYSHGQVVTPKSGHGRAVPMVPEVAQVLARLDQREHFTGRGDLVFPNAVGEHVDASALRRRYLRALKDAGLRSLRFHEYADLLVMPTGGYPLSRSRLRAVVEAAGPRAGCEYPGTWSEFRAWFPDDASCAAHLERLRWPAGVACRACGETRGWRTAEGRWWVCAGCAVKTSVTAGTIFDKTRTPLTSWFAAAWFATSQKNGLSALGLQRALGLGSYQTAWMMLHRFRVAMVRPGREQLAGTVEADETYVGGEEPDVYGRETQSKSIVAIAVEVREPRGFGRARLQRVPDVTAPSLVGFVQATVTPGSTVHTDGWPSYATLPAHGYAHTKTILSASGDPAHVSMPAVHRVASLLKRWLLGTHQGSVSPQHLDAYLNEFTFRFNRRTSRRRGLLFHRLLEQAVLTPPTTYKDTVRPDRRSR